MMPCPRDQCHELARTQPSDDPSAHDQPGLVCAERSPADASNAGPNPGGSASATHPASTGSAVGLDALSSILNQVFSGVFGGPAGMDAAQLAEERRARQTQHIHSLQDHDGNSLTVLQAYIDRCQNHLNLARPNLLLPVVNPTHARHSGQPLVQLSEITRAALAVIDEYQNVHATDICSALGEMSGSPLPEAAVTMLTELIAKARIDAAKTDNDLAAALERLTASAPGTEAAQVPDGVTGTVAEPTERQEDANAPTIAGLSGRASTSEGAGSGSPEALCALHGRLRVSDATRAASAGSGAADEDDTGSGVEQMEGGGRGAQRRRALVPYEYLTLALVAYNLLLQQSRGVVNSFQAALARESASMHRSLVADLVHSDVSVFSGTQVCLTALGQAVLFLASLF
jgi:hypothetical protein